MVSGTDHNPMDIGKFSAVLEYYSPRYGLESIVQLRVI